jgi:hypothetical protein
MDNKIKKDMLKVLALAPSVAVSEYIKTLTQAQKMDALKLANALKIKIIDRDVEFEGTLGEYETSVVKSKINNKPINLVFPNESRPGELIILLGEIVLEEE